MIKQIQLRGISHIPSDRLNADGGLEDCIDLRLVENEQAPVTPPVNVTDTLAPGLSSSGIEVLYIHKTNTYTNYVGTKVYTEDDEDVNKLVAYVNNPNDVGANTAGWVTKVITDEVIFPIVSITSVGNIIIVYDNAGKTHYSLFKDNSYTYLGTEIPRPVVTFSVDGESDSNSTQEIDVTALVNEYKDANSNNNPTALQLWEYVRAHRGSGLSEDFYNTLHQNFWDGINAMRSSSTASKYFSAPVFVRYAVRLYDGSYIHVSEPICLNNGINVDVPNFKANVVPSVYSAAFRYKPVLSSRFSAEAYITYSVSNWSDLIDSVDLFLSTDILLPSSGAGLSTASELTSKMDADATGYDISITFEGRTNDEVEDFRNKIDEVSNFYRVASYMVNSLPGSSEDIVPLSQDSLVVLPRLGEDNQSHSISAIGNLSSYNNRLVSGAQSITLSPGHSQPHAIADDSTGTERLYRIYYHVRDANGEDHLILGYHPAAEFYNNSVKAFVAYPDPKCYQADLYYGVTDIPGHTTLYKTVLPMREHPRLNCSYGFWGLDHLLEENAEVVSTEPYNFTPTYKVDNRLALTEMDNPFVFPLGQRQRFSTRILSAVPVTTALSTSQFGQFPLYVFTEDGIWTISMNDEGGIAASHPVSRDVAVEGTIAQLDQAIVFVSSQGVMMVSGSQIICLSPNMQGLQYTIADIAPAGSDLWDALMHDGWGPLLDIHLDTTDFQDFVEGCRPIYDYGNKRILFFNANEDYAYDYALDTQTWSKVSVPAFFERSLNGYPDALGVFGGEIFNWSVRAVYNDADPPSRKGILVTRPFDLGEPDVRKAIKSLRIRGYFNHTNVKYMLLGSMNGIVWRKLLSLRGGSYKSFRLVILADLEPGERITWVDVDYEGRFADKLR